MKALVRPVISLVLAFLLALSAFADDRPQLVSSTPAHGQDGVNPLAPAKLVFSKPMDPAPARAADTFRLYDFSAGYRPGVFVSWSADGTAAELSFGYPGLRIGAAYRLELNAANLKDRAGNALVPVPPIQFNTSPHPDKTGPRFAGAVPADGETGVALNTAIYVVFDEPLSGSPCDDGVTVTAPSGSLKFTCAVAADHILQIKTPLLLPANQRITVGVSGAVDRSGNVLADPVVFSFQTGALPDTQTQSLKFVPPATSAAVFPLHVTFAKPVDPPFLSADTVVIQDASQAVLGTASCTLSADRRTLTIDSGPTLPGRYTISISVPFDRTQGKLSAFSFPVILGANADPAPARLRAASPPGGTQDAPTSSPIRFAYTRPVDVAGAPAAFSVVANGEAVAGDLLVSGNGAVVTFKPRSPLQPATTYTVSVAGLSDFGGNPVAPYFASFTTSASGAYADAFRVVSADPPAKATGVDPSTPVTLTFSRAIDPVNVFAQFKGSFTDTAGTVPCGFEVDGAVLTIRPGRPLANGNVSVSVYGVTDLGGATAASFSTSFSVSGGQPDTVPPEVLSVSPGDGETVLYSAARVELIFSEPIDSATVAATLPGSLEAPVNFGAFQDGVTALSLKAIAISSTHVALEFSGPPGATVTLIAGSGLTDAAGNGLVPFRTTVRLSGKPSGGASRLIRITPASYYCAATTGNAITAWWTAPLDRASVEANLLVYTPDGLVTGRFDWTGDSRAFSFTPAAPIRDGVTVMMSLTAPAHDAAGLPVELASTLSTCYSDSSSGGALAIAGSNFSAHIPTNFLLDVRFNQDLTDAVLPAIKAAIGTDRKAMVNFPFTRIRPRVLRFRPPFALAAGTTYYFSLEGPNLKWETAFAPENVTASSQPRVVAAGPSGAGVPQNAIVSILFSEPVSGLAVPGGVRLLLNGVEVPTSSELVSGQGISLQPLTFLKAGTEYTVAVEGVENLAGIAVPSRSWTFRTGSAIDPMPLTLLRVRPPGANASPDAVSFLFDKAVAPATAPAAFNLRYSTNAPAIYEPVTVTLAFSDDLKTVFLRPAAPLAAGATVSASAGAVTDLAGNTSVPDYINAGSHAFQVAFGPAPAVTVTGTSPRSEALGVPLNTRIQLRYSGNVTLSGDIAAELFENGSPLAAALRIEGDGCTVSVIPARPLAAASRIDVAVTGISASPDRFSFSTGTAPDLLSPALTVWPVNGLSPVPATVVARIRFNEPLNPLTVHAGTVTLKASNNALIDAAVALDDSGRVVSLTPRLPLSAGGTYALSASVADLAGNTATSNTSFSVGPPDGPAAVLRGIDPGDGATGVNARPSILAIFSKLVDLTLGDDSFRLLLDGAPVQGAVTASGSTHQFSPARALQPGATYRVEIRGVVDVFGNPVPDASSSFTVAAPDFVYTPLRLLSSVPVNGAVGVAANSPIRLTFNRPVTLASALALSIGAGSAASAIASVRLEGNDVVIEPVIFSSGGVQVYLRGSVRDAFGGAASVSLFYTVAPVADTTPPVLEYAYPPADSVIPAFGATLVLRFSEPVTVAPNAIRVVGAAVDYPYSWYSAQDGRTYTATLNLAPDSDITIVIGAGVADLAGNPIVPVSHNLRTLSAEESRLPKVGSVTPPAGAINVAVDASIQLQFTHAMDPVSVGLGLRVTADGIPVTGSLAASPGNRSFQFKPDAGFRKGAVVAVIVTPPAVDTVGQLLDPFHSSFTVIKDAAVSTPAPVAISASANAIDVRFDAPLDRYSPAPYIRLGSVRVPSRWELRGADSIRVVPDEPLEAGRSYRLVLDDNTELPLTLTNAANRAAIESASYDGRAIRLRFDREMNPISPGIKLSKPDGTAVPYYLEWALDRREALLRPALPAPDLIVTIDDAAAHRLTAPPL
jgi:methionine-rich copper-binding protein CopC